jgi:hypothetical protein
MKAKYCVVSLITDKDPQALLNKTEFPTKSVKSKLTPL